MGHAWHVIHIGPADAATDLPRSAVYRHWWLIVDADCVRCSTRRIDYFADRAVGRGRIDPYRVAHRRYIYPEGYKVKGEAVTRSEARRAMWEAYQRGTA